MRRMYRIAPLALLLVSFTALLSSRGETVPLFAARTGLQCQNCHFDPNGGGPRNDFGFAYARNRHSVETEPEGSAWSSLDVTNKVSDTFPLTFGVNQRFMMLRFNTDRADDERLAFFNMESNLHFAFQPHEKLTLVYSMDAFGPARDVAAVARSKEAFGMIGLPMGAYFRAGRFRVPFGLRMDDHTVATRNAFLDFSGGSFLPYDPRDPDLGYEIGATSGPFFGRAAFTNGPASLLSNEFAETKSVKLGYGMGTRYHGAVSLYDEYNKNGGALKRATRWGYYGMTSFGPVTLLGEVAAGTDEDEPTVPGMASGPKTNRLAWFGELNVTPVRWLNGRLRYDYLVLDRSSDPAVREANTHQRYALEAEWLPVPFAEIRATYRLIDHKGDAALDPLLEDEQHGYLQFHFAY